MRPVLTNHGQQRVHLVYKDKQISQNGVDGITAVVFSLVHRPETVQQNLTE